MLSVRVFLVLGLWLVAAAVFGFLVAPRSNEGFADDAAVLAFASLVAIAIERMLELFWTLVGQSRLGGWWPLKQIGDVFATVETETNNLLDPILKDTERVLSEAREGLNAGSAELKRLDEALALVADQKAAYGKRLAAARQIAPSSERLALIAGISADVSSFLASAVDATEKGSAEVKKTISAVDETVGLAMSVAESFSDNPARRVASILIGGGLGMIAASFVGLNIFSSVLGGEAGYLAAGLGVILTGFVVGLGSSPFHEVVKALQNYKKSRAPSVDTTPGDPSAAVMTTNSRSFKLRGTQ